MYLKKLSLINFRNYQDATLELSPTVNCFTGNNGSGKTNLLDAIHYLSMTRSYFNSSDSQNIRHGDSLFIIQGEFEKEESSDVLYCGIKQGQKKVFKRNQKEYTRLSDHIGLFPVVMIAPTDQQLITEGSENRRKFLDSVISQYDHQYLDDLIRYNQVLAQRNILLKQAAAKGLMDWSMMTVWDDQLSHYGTRIYEKRLAFISGFEPLFMELFDYISSGTEVASIHYDSQLHGSTLKTLLEENHSRDLDQQYTTHGIHKDDLDFRLKQLSVKKYASQGQQKSIVTALKLAHYSFLKQKGFSKPIVLLDDIFDKLDDSRVSRLMELVNRDEFGQLFITDTNHSRVVEMFKKINIPVRIFHVDNGNVEISETYEKVE